MGTQRDDRPALPINNPITTFIGHQDVLSNVRTLISSSRLVTLTGVGGIGKTRLAEELRSVIEVDFLSETRLVELASLRKDREVAEAVVAALGLKASTTLDPLTQLSRYLVDRPLLLVFDNCEHVLAGCREVVHTLLGEAPRLHILATSREPLRINGERIINIPPLSIPVAEWPTDLKTARSYEAVALLEERARNVNESFTLDEDNLHDAIHLCIRLDGLPLAIELAAARLRILSLSHLVELIDDRFSILTKGDPTALPHHRTLEALVEWSYELCSPEEQSLWNRLSVFTGGADLDAIIGVCIPNGSPVELIDLLDSLVSKSVLIPEEVQKRIRYRLPETLSAYGRQHLIGTQERQLLLERHAEYFRQLARNASIHCYSADQHEWLLRLQNDRANIAAAFDFLISEDVEEGQAALELAASLRFYWTTGNLREGRQWLEKALDHSLDITLTRGNALWSCAWVAALQGDLDGADRRLDEARVIAAELKSDVMAAHVETWGGVIALFRGDLTKARATSERAISAHRVHADLEGLLWSLFHLGITCVVLEDSTAAYAACKEAIMMSRISGESWVQSYALWALAHNAWIRSDLTSAVELAQQSITIKFRYSDNVGIALVLSVLAGIDAERSEYDRAGLLLGVTSRFWESLGTDVATFGPQLAGTYSGVEKRVRKELENKYSQAFTAGIRMNTEEIQHFILNHETFSALHNKKLSESAVLTEREREVAQLLGLGLTNKKIAAKLVLSPRTIEGHVQQTLRKLGFHSRTEIAVWAANHFGE